MPNESGQAPDTEPAADAEDEAFDWAFIGPKHWHVFDIVARRSAEGVA